MKLVLLCLLSPLFALGQCTGLSQASLDNQYEDTSGFFENQIVLSIPQADQYLLATGYTHRTITATIGGQTQTTTHDLTENHGAGLYYPGLHFAPWSYVTVSMTESFTGPLDTLTCPTSTGSIRIADPFTSIP